MRKIESIEKNNRIKQAKTDADVETKKVPIGVYVHVPFCNRKCPYCDFYSLPQSASRMDEYVVAVLRSMRNFSTSNQDRIVADTLYFGGGTPSLLGAERLGQIITCAKDCFGLNDAEITVEVNPTADSKPPTPFFERLYQAGANRISMGMQSTNPEELRALGRSHTPEQVREAVNAAQKAGFSNISLDLMLAIPYQTEESLLESIRFCAEANIPHVSAYLLKVEPGTPFYTQKDSLLPLIPDEDGAAERYLFAVEALEKRGFHQYEISNFAKETDGQLVTSRHNLKYWHGEEYLGIGPAAHSFFRGKRFYYPRDLEHFLSGCAPIPDGDGGSEEEFALLSLRLTSGLTNAIWQERFGVPLPEGYLRRAKKFVAPGLVQLLEHGEGFRFTPRGFLVSNALLAEILE